MYFRIKLLAITALFLSTGMVQGQNTWTYPDIEINLYPEILAVCPGNSIKVQTIHEYTSYSWEKDGVVYGTGQVVSLEEPGNYEVHIEAVIDGVTCLRSKSFEVADASDPAGIKSYLESAGFYGVSIWRENLPVGAAESTCEVEDIKFTPNGNSFTSIDAVANAVLTEFKPLKDLENEEFVYTKNDCFCDGSINDYLDEFNSGDKAIWTHEWFASDDDYKGILFSRVRMPFEPSLPTTEQIGHFESIHFEMLALNGTAYDQARVLLSNNFMAHPIGGFQLNGACTPDQEALETSHFLTPAEVAVLIPEGATNLTFADRNTGENIIEGSLLQFSLNESGNNNKYQSFRRKDITDKMNGYYNFMFADFFENFTTSESNCNACEVDITQQYFGCGDLQCKFETEKFTNTFFNFENVYDGGFGYQLEACVSSWIRSGISFEESNALLYDLLCAIKSGDPVFNFDDKFKGKVIFGREMWIGNYYYDYIGVSMPDENSPSYINLNTDLEFADGGSTGGFESSLNISSDQVNKVRLNFFDITTDSYTNYGQCRWAINPAYINSFWNFEKFWDIQGCLASAVQRDEFLDLISDDYDENLLIMVNGYRPRSLKDKNWYSALVTEHPQPTPENAISNCFDNYDISGHYWGGTAFGVMNQINNKNIVFADAQHKMYTSMHNSKTQYAASQKACIGLLINQINCDDCFHNTIPNDSGFTTRHKSGVKGGKELWNRIQSGKVKVARNAAGKITGVIDIVAHSFGYAYAKGMNDFFINGDPSENIESPLAPGVTLGIFYIIAPENPAGISSGLLDLNNPDHQKFIIDQSDYEEVWHFGSDYRYNNPSDAAIGEDLCYQDGVAHQAAIPGLTVDNSRFIPKDRTDIRNFLDAHSTVEQVWILNERKINGDLIFKKRNE